MALIEIIFLANYLNIVNKHSWGCFRGTMSNEFTTADCFEEFMSLKFLSFKFSRVHETFMHQKIPQSSIRQISGILY